MYIEVDNCKVINVVEKCLIVKDKRLYNTVTKQFEGVEGDGVTICYLNAVGEKCWVSGTVEGYTCNRRVKLRGNPCLFSCAEGTIKIINVLATITDTDCEEEEVNEEVKTQTEEDWETILSA